MLLPSPSRKPEGDQETRPPSSPPEPKHPIAAHEIYRGIRTLGEKRSGRLAC